MGALLPRLATLLAERPVVSAAVRSAQRYLAIGGTQRALVLASQAFSAVIPLLIVVSTMTSQSGGLRIAESMITRFQLSGNAADAVRTLFAQPPGAGQSITVGSALLLVLSGLSFARSLQRTYAAAWQVSPRGVRKSFGGLAALLLLVTEILLLSLLAGFLRGVPAGSALTFLLRVIASSALWLVLQWLLLGGTIDWRRLLRGAIVTGVGQQVVAALSTLWIPGVVQNNASRFGAIGVSFALLSWLVLICVVLVVAAAVSVELGDGPPVPESAEARGLLPALARLLGADDAAAGDESESSRGRPAGPPDGGEPPDGGDGSLRRSDLEERHG